MRKKGLLIANTFLHTTKFQEHYEWLKQAAARLDISLELCGNADRLWDMTTEPDWLDGYDFVLFWDKDIRYGELLEDYAGRHGIPIFNTIESIGVCDDKFETFRRLNRYNAGHPQEKIPLIPTVSAPMTYSNIGYNSQKFLDQVEKILGYPMVIKECYGSFGMQVYLAENRQELERRSWNLAGTPFIYQKYLAQSSGRDVRLQVVGDRVVAAMLRYSQNGDFRANITNGGSMQKYEPAPSECRLALQVCRVLGLDFAGVDLLFDRGEDQPAGVVCEVNSNAHFKNIYSCTRINVAEHIMGYIAQKIQENEGR